MSQDPFDPYLFMSEETLNFAATLFSMEDPLQAQTPLQREDDLLVNQVRGFTQRASATVGQAKAESTRATSLLEKALNDAEQLEGKLFLALCQKQDLQETLSAQADYRAIVDELKLEVADLQEAKEVLTQKCKVNEKLIQSMLARRASTQSQALTIARLEAELQALKSSQPSTSSIPSSSSIPTTDPAHLPSSIPHTDPPPSSPPSSFPLTDEPPSSVPSTSSPVKDKQVEDYAQWEQIIRESAATAYLQPVSIPYHLPTLPLPLLRHQSVLCQRTLTPNLTISDAGTIQVAGLPQDVLDAIIADQPTWRAKWFRQRPGNKELYNLAPLELQCDPIYCPIRRRRTWESHQRWASMFDCSAAAAADTDTATGGQLQNF